MIFPDNFKSNIPFSEMTECIYQAMRFLVVKHLMPTKPNEEKIKC